MRQRDDFPPEFWWGTATAAYPIEGAVAEGGRKPSIWDTFSHTPGKTAHGGTGDVACDHDHRYPEVVKWMADLAVKHYRFSISWPRILPDGKGKINEKGVDFYRRLVEALDAHGITPHGTLYHWDLPQAVQDRRSSPSPSTPSASTATRGAMSGPRTMTAASRAWSTPTTTRE